MEPKEETVRTLLETMNYLGLPKSSFLNEDFVSLDIKALHPDLPYKSPPFRTNLYSITLVMDGNGHYKSDGAAFEILPKMLFFNNPGGLREIEWNRISKVYHYSFSDHFLLKYAGIHIYQTFPFLLLETSLPEHTDPSVFQKLAEICDSIDTEHEINSPYSRSILANLLIRLLLETKDAILVSNEASRDRSTDVLKNFIQNLESHFEHLRTGKTTTQLKVKDYASMQKLHENYFSNIIKGKSGKTANQWIAEKTNFIAVRMIEDSSLSIKEIAFRLGFQHASHFTSYFKKSTGLSPIVFRKMNSKTPVQLSYSA
ncbi:helix-turn-helix domain-containing protein [Flavobacterium sp. F52]|uniref:helix-turn-helix domain-containing protein n=1 Tax=Flavobacterium sp. F52 TaxID=1202532 RepID=UPI000272D872|nr:AraC family transcriptional regulator [Flavobacterium sp. F52]EJG03185.1 transcriptional regulator, arac family protein [Flavobacterium sp. F52]